MSLAARRPLNHSVLAPIRRERRGAPVSGANGPGLQPYGMSGPPAALNSYAPPFAANIPSQR